MAKKEYASALQGALSQFITTTPPETQAAPQGPKNAKEQAQDTTTAKNCRILSPEEIAQRKERAKNNAKFINTPTAMYKAPSDKKNPRGRQVHLLMRASTCNELLAIAHSQGRSLNNLIEGILLDYLEARGNE